MLECRHVFKKFDGKMVVKDCDFTVKKGEIIGLMGESGSGKSTLAKLLIGLEKPSQGLTGWPALLSQKVWGENSAGLSGLAPFSQSTLYSRAGLDRGSAKRCG